MSGAGKAVYKVLGLSAGLLSGKVARSALDKGWAKTRGGEPPRNPAVPGVSWGEALTWAIASGVAVSVARLLADRTIARTWAKATGSLPPGVDEVGN